MKTVKEALEYREHYPELKIIREVRFYAQVKGVYYELTNDWESRDLDDLSSYDRYGNYKKK